MLGFFLEWNLKITYARSMLKELSIGSSIGFSKPLNDNGIKKIRLYNVYGQRYIGTNLRSKINLEVHGTPGNDLGVFMDGPEIIVYGNVQDCCGNTMNDGYIVVHGRAGDITGYSMRGGKIFHQR